jgi:hypothetical protein
MWPSRMATLARMIITCFRNISGSLLQMDNWRRNTLSKQNLWMWKDVSSGRPKCHLLSQRFPRHERVLALSTSLDQWYLQFRHRHQDSEDKCWNPTVQTLFTNKMKILFTSLKLLSLPIWWQNNCMRRGKNRRYPGDTNRWFSGPFSAAHKNTWFISPSFELLVLWLTGSS